MQNIFWIKFCKNGHCDILLYYIFCSGQVELSNRYWEEQNQMNSRSQGSETISEGAFLFFFVKSYHFVLVYHTVILLDWTLKNGIILILSNEVMWSKKISNYMQGLKSAILAIFQTGPGWPCTVSVALKNPSLNFKKSFCNVCRWIPSNAERHK